MNTKLIGVIIAASIAILMSGSILMPVINDAVDDTKVYYNNGAGHYASITDETVTINATLGEGDNAMINYTVNGESVGANRGKTTILISDNCTIYGPYTNTIELTGIDKNGNLISPVRYSSITAIISSDSIDLTGVVVSDSSTVNYEFDNNWAFYRSNSGDYRVLDNIRDNTLIYINDINQIYSSNWITTTSEFFNLNGDDVTVRDGTTETTTTASVTLNSVMNGVKSFLISSDRTSSAAFHFEVDNAGEPYDVYPFYFVIPASVYGQTESNESYTALLYAIPVILLTAIVATIALMFARRY